jgi:hypothetical protein
MQCPGCRGFHESVDITIVRLLRKLEVHYHVHNCPSLDSVLSQLNPYEIWGSRGSDSSMLIFSAVMPRGLVSTYYRFGEIYCLHLQGWRWKTKYFSWKFSKETIHTFYPPYSEYITLVILDDKHILVHNAHHDVCTIFSGLSLFLCPLSFLKENNSALT